MTNLQLLAEVRQFFPHARCRVRGAAKVSLRNGASLAVAPMIDGGWFVLWAYGHEFRCDSATTPAEALRALGFAERSPGAFCNKNRHRAEYIRQFDFVVTDFPLQSRQRPRKGARLGARKRREAKS